MTMIRGETPAPVRAPALPGDARCSGVRAELSRRMSEDEVRLASPDLRAHLDVCADCNALYRELLLADARLRRAMLQAGKGLPQEERPARRAVLSPLAVARAGFGSGGRGKASWVVGLGILFYAAVRLTPDPSGVARAQVSALAGSVESAGDPLEPGQPVQELRRGDWVRTPEGARAQLWLDATSVDVGGASSVQIEEPATRRVRLEEGTLQVAGPLLVTSRFGLVEVLAGRAELSLGSAGLTVESPGGNVRAIDARGEHVLEPGQRLAFAR